MVILIESPKKQVYGRGKAACVRYCMFGPDWCPRNENKLQINCSCWEEVHISCSSTEEFSCHLSVNEAISKFLLYDDRLSGKSEDEAPVVFEKGVWKCLPTAYNDRKKLLVFDV